MAWAARLERIPAMRWGPCKSSAAGGLRLARTLPDCCQRAGGCLTAGRGPLVVFRSWQGADRTPWPAIVPPFSIPAALSPFTLIPA
jgi:hypothetical protein